jgi:hypothetical protein
MKTYTNIIAALGLVAGFVSSGYAATSGTQYVDETNQRIQQYREMVSADTALNYSEILLQRSSVAHKLKFSNNPVDNARYAKALDVYKAAEHAYLNGNEEQAKKLALESIRVIARAIPQYYSQTAKAEQ